MINILPYKNEIYRKSIHLSSLIIPAIYAFVNYSTFIYLISIITILVTILDMLRQKNSYVKYLFNKIFYLSIREYEINNFMSATYLLYGFLSISLIFNQKIVIISMLITCISDSIAALFGIKYGRIKLLHNKTFEGTFLFCLSAYFIISILDFNIFKSMLFCMLIGSVELSTPTKYDNLTVPISSSIILYIGTIL